MGMFEVIFDQAAYQEHQAFYDGLAAAALIEYYQATGDPRVPPAIKKMLDWIWSSGAAWPSSNCLIARVSAWWHRYRMVLLSAVIQNWSIS